MPAVPTLDANALGGTMHDPEPCIIPGRPENCFAGGGDGMGARRRRGGKVPEMGFRAGPFVLCKDGCCHQRRPEHKFWPGKFFFTKKFSPTYV